MSLFSKCYGRSDLVLCYLFSIFSLLDFVCVFPFYVLKILPLETFWLVCVCVCLFGFVWFCLIFFVTKFVLLFPLRSFRFRFLFSVFQFFVLIEMFAGLRLIFLICNLLCYPSALIVPTCFGVLLLSIAIFYLSSKYLFVSVLFFVFSLICYRSTLIVLTCFLVWFASFNCYLWYFFEMLVCFCFLFCFLYLDLLSFRFDRSDLFFGLVFFFQLLFMILLWNGCLFPFGFFLLGTLIWYPSTLIVPACFLVCFFQLLFITFLRNAYLFPCFLFCTLICYPSALIVLTCFLASFDCYLFYFFEMLVCFRLVFPFL